MEPKKEQTTQVSDQVVGQLTDVQQQELSLLGINLITANDLDPKNPSSLETAKAVLEDCIYRGLATQGRVWFSTNESVSPIFEAGLRKRKAIIDELERTQGLAAFLRYSATSLNGVSAFDIDIEPAVRMTEMLKNRGQSVAKFHQSLFQTSRLADEAKELRSQFHQPDAMNKLSETDQNFLVNNQLYTNLLINTALYGRPGIYLEPKDVATLGNIWHDRNARDIKQAELIARMVEIATNLGLPKEDIKAYTENILDDLNTVIEGGRFTIEELRDYGVFGVTEESYQAETSQMEQSREKQAEIIEISPEDLAKSMFTFDKFTSYLTRLEGVVEEADEKDEPIDELLESFTENEYLPFMKGLTPLDIIIIEQNLGRSFRSIAETILDTTRYHMIEDLADLVPFDTYFKALQMLDGHSFRLKGSARKIPELEGANLKYVTGKIEEDVVLRLINEQIGTASYKSVVENLPITSLRDYLSRVVMTELNRVQQSAIIRLSNERWVDLILSTESSVGVDPTRAGAIEVIFEGNGTRLEDSFKSLPTEKQQAIAQEVQTAKTVNI